MSKSTTDQGLAGFNVSSQLTNIRAGGQLPLTSYDLLKNFTWIISIIKFLAHIFSLPLMAVLRRDFGMRYVDDVHILASFIIWQIAGMLSFGDGLLNQLASPLIGAVGWIFLPLAFYHRYRAKQAALRGENYSYHPGMPRLARLALPVMITVYRLLGSVLKRFRSTLPVVYTHPAEVLTIDVMQGGVRRFIEPFVVGVLGVMCLVFDVSTGFGMFLIWTAIMLHFDETITQRIQWEMFLDAVDAQVIGQEKQRVLSGESGGSRTGFSVASLADLKTNMKV